MSKRKQVERLKENKYLGTVINDLPNADNELKIRIEMAQSAFILLCSQKEVYTRK